MTAAADRQHVRFLGGILAAGFTSVSTVLALVFADSLLVVGFALVPAVMLLAASRGELQDLEDEPESSAPTAATDGGRQLSETDTGGSQNSRHNT